MAGVDTQIAELNVEIAKYKKQLTDLEADFEEAEPRDEEGIKNDIRRKEDAIIETRKTVNLLLQQQTVQAHPGSIEMHKLFKPKNV
jgi:hypothetical protein